MVKIFHEAPNSIFKQIQNVTDGDYCLVHLLDENETYRKLFLDAVSMGREVILDNSVFELGEAYDEERYLHWIDKLKPTWYIIPDVFNNMLDTIQSAERWYNLKLDLHSKSIGVVQGETLDEALMCYDKIFNLVDMVAIPFHCRFYEDEFGFNKDDSIMRGRQRFLEILNNEYSPPPNSVHLLGQSLPQESIVYSNYEWIYSIDTSNPVVHGMNDILYENNGLPFKIKKKLHEMIDWDVSSRHLDIILYNIEKYKGFWK